MAVSVIDGTIEEVELKRRRKLGSVYSRVLFRLRRRQQQDLGQVGRLEQCRRPAEAGDERAASISTPRSTIAAFTACRTATATRSTASARSTNMSRSACSWSSPLHGGAVDPGASGSLPLLAAILIVLSVPMYLLYRQHAGAGRAAVPRRCGLPAGRRLMAGWQGAGVYRDAAGLAPAGARGCSMRTAALSGPGRRAGAGRAASSLIDGDGMRPRSGSVSCALARSAIADRRSSSGSTAPMPMRGRSAPTDLMGSPGPRRRLVLHPARQPVHALYDACATRGGRAADPRDWQAAGAPAAILALVGLLARAPASPPRSPSGSSSSTDSTMPRRGAVARPCMSNCSAIPAALLRSASADPERCRSAAQRRRRPSPDQPSRRARQPSPTIAASPTVPRQARPPAVKESAVPRSTASLQLAAPGRSVPAHLLEALLDLERRAAPSPSVDSSQRPPATAGTIHRKMRRPSSASSASGRQSPMSKGVADDPRAGAKLGQQARAQAEVDLRQQIERDHARLVDRRAEQILPAEDGAGLDSGDPRRGMRLPAMRSGSRSTPSARAPRCAAATAIRPSPQPRSIR